MPLRATDLFHTGVVVNDLESSIDRLSAVAGYRWTKPLAATTAVRTPQGDTEVPFRIVYSLDAPHVELIQTVSGTLWVPAPHSSIHHLGYFVDDLEATSAELAAAGLELQACGLDVEGSPHMFAYHRGDDGILIELVDRRTMDFQALLALMS